MNKEQRDNVPSITVHADLALERVLTLELVRVTERAAVSAARLSGRGNEKAADQAAVDAMRRELNKLPIDGTIVIGEGERDEAPMLFIGETVRASIEDGTLELRDGRMTLVGPRPPRLPLTLRAVLGARIDSLDEPARDVIGVASVIGIGFDDRDLADLLAHPVEPATLDRLVDAALIVPVGDGRWRFSHPLVHDAAYAGILATRRRRLHARLADTLEARPGSTSVAMIAGHRAASGDGVRAVPLLDEAATTALAMGAAAEAAGFWRTAADLATDPAVIAQFRDAAGAAMTAARAGRSG
jgi:hypothetical protein